MGQPVVHFEIIGKDGERLRSYYSELFGWEIDADNPMNYGMIQRDGNTNADGLGIGGGIGTGPEGYDGHVTFYVEVPDVEAALAAAIALNLTLADRVTFGPTWLLPSVEGALLAALVIIAPSRAASHTRRIRRFALGVIGLVSLANIVSLGLLVHYLVNGGKVG